MMTLSLVERRYNRNHTCLVPFEGEIEQFGHLNEGLRVHPRDAVVVEQEAPQVGEAEGVVLHGGDPVEAEEDFHG